MIQLRQHFSSLGWVCDGEFCPAFKVQHQTDIACRCLSWCISPNASAKAARNFVIMNALEVHAAMSYPQKFCHGVIVNQEERKKRKEESSLALNFCLQNLLPKQKALVGNCLRPPLKRLFHHINSFANVEDSRQGVFGISRFLVNFQGVVF